MMSTARLSVLARSSSAAVVARCSPLRVRSLSTRSAPLFVPNASHQPTMSTDDDWWTAHGMPMLIGSLVVVAGSMTIFKMMEPDVRPDQTDIPRHKLKQNKQ